MRLEVSEFVLMLPAFRVVLQMPECFVRRVDAKIVQSEGWPNVKPAVRRTQQMPQFLMSHVGVSERRSIAIEFLPVRFRNEWFHLLEQGSAWIRRQDFEHRNFSPEIDRIV